MTVMSCTASADPSATGLSASAAASSSSPSASGPDGPALFATSASTANPFLLQQLGARVDSASSPTAVAAGAHHAVVAFADGSVMAWGANEHGQLGDGSTASSTSPVMVRAADGDDGTLTGVVDVAADSHFSMALLKDGTVVTWGLGDAGQRGNGTDTTSLLPTTVLAPEGDRPLTDVAGMDADGRTAVAVLEDGRVLTWGANGFGQLGDGTTTDRSLPGFVQGRSGQAELDDATQVSVGGQHAVALLENGTVVAWGRNDRGQLGDGTRTDRSLPGAVLALQGQDVLRGVSAVSAAEKYTAALLSDATAVGWGANAAGQLGDGTRTERLRPVQALSENGKATLSSIDRIEAGEAYVVAVLDDGSALSWGANGHGQLADGSTRLRTLPKPVLRSGGIPVGTVHAVSAGERQLVVVAVP